jgi:hypothetical protein
MWGKISNCGEKYLIVGKISNSGEKYLIMQ